MAKMKLLIANMERSDSGWITCKDRLPEKTRHYLINIKNEKFGNIIEICYYFCLPQKWYYLIETLKQCPDRTIHGGISGRIIPDNICMQK